MARLYHHWSYHRQLMNVRSWERTLRDVKIWLHNLPEESPLAHGDYEYAPLQLRIIRVDLGMICFEGAGEALVMEPPITGSHPRERTVELKGPSDFTLTRIERRPSAWEKEDFLRIEGMPYEFAASGVLALFAWNGLLEVTSEMGPDYWATVCQQVSRRTGMTQEMPSNCIRWSRSMLAGPRYNGRAVEVLDG